MEACSCYSFENPRVQYFSIPSTIIHYINQNKISPIGLAKLQKTSKWFYANQKIIIVDRGEFERDLWTTNMYKFKLSRMQKYKDVKFWYIGVLQFSKFDMIKFFDLQLHHYSITELCILYFDLTLREFTALTASESLKQISMYDCAVVEDDCQKGDVPLDILFSNLKNVNWFVHCRKHEDNKTAVISKPCFQNFLKLTNQHKFVHIWLWNYALSEDVEPELFTEFFKQSEEIRGLFGFRFFYASEDQRSKFLAENVPGKIVFC